MELPGFKTENPAKPAQIAKIKDWVRAGLKLTPEARVMVTELQCLEEGCPPVETVLAVLDDCCAFEKRKVHKPVMEITEEDILSVVSGREPHGHAQ